jgi:hypothetical protein
MGTISIHTDQNLYVRTFLDSVSKANAICSTQAGLLGVMNHQSIAITFGQLIFNGPSAIWAVIVYKDNQSFW